MMSLVYLKKIDKSNFTLESEILLEGGKIGRLNRTFGHLLYTCRRFNHQALYVAEREWVYKEAERMMKREGSLAQIKIKKQEVKIDLIKRLLLTGPIILGVDNYVFNRDFHFPHFVLVEKIKNDKFQVIEPWEGKRLDVTKGTLTKAIKSLEDVLLYWRELIQVHE